MFGHKELLCSCLHFFKTQLDRLLCLWLSGWLLFLVLILAYVDISWGDVPEGHIHNSPAFGVVGHLQDFSGCVLSEVDDLVDDGGIAELPPGDPPHLHPSHHRRHMPEDVSVEGVEQPI